MGRLIEVKAADVFLDAVAVLCRRGVVFRASIVGDGRQRAALESRAARLGLVGVVSFHGSVVDVPRAFRAFDVFVLSSRSEGTPVVLLEAMAAGIPVVATRVGGVPDVVSGGEAVLVPPDDPHSLAAGIARVLEDPEAAVARAGAARLRLESGFATEAWLERHAALYNAVGSRRTA